MPKHVHIVPKNDIHVHTLDMSCGCVPHVERIDPETGKEYPDGNMNIIHNSFDGREHHEQVIDDAPAGSDGWEVYEVEV